MAPGPSGLRHLARLGRAAAGKAVKVNEIEQVALGVAAADGGGGAASVGQQPAGEGMLAAQVGDEP